MRFNHVYIVLHDAGREYYHDSIGEVMGCYVDYGEAKLALGLDGFEDDKHGNWWKGKDRAWIIEKSVREFSNML